MGKKAKQDPLPGVASEEEINPPSRLESKNLKAIGKEASKAKVAVVAAIDSIKDKIADGCAAPESCEKAIQHFEKALEDIGRAQDSIRGASD